MSATAEPKAEVVVRALKLKGLRATPQRCAVYANLLARCDHPTVEEILVDLNQALPVSSRATVYSSLQALRDVGLVREVLLEEGISRFDANVDAHHHFRCDCCGRIEDIPWEALPVGGLDRLRSGLSVAAYEVTVHGCCDRCSAENSTANS
ncbi:MAG: Fur family transcriptional regulator [Cyanobacteria bacterium J06641_5]